MEQPMLDKLKKALSEKNAEEVHEIFKTIVENKYGTIIAETGNGEVAVFLFEPRNVLLKIEFDTPGTYWEYSGKDFVTKLEEAIEDVFREEAHVIDEDTTRLAVGYLFDDFDYEDLSDECL